MLLKRYQRAIGTTVLVGAAALLAWGTAPVPPLKVTLAVKTVNGRTLYMVSATNIYSSAATEFIITAPFLLPPSHPCHSKTRSADGRCKGLFVVHRSMVPGYHGEPGHPVPGAWVVPAGQTIPVGEMQKIPGATVPEASCMAVIYEDGAMAGDPAVLHMLLLERQIEFRDAVWAANLLEQAVAATNTDLGALAGKLEARFAAYRQAWQLRFKNWHGTLPPGATTGDLACRNAAGELRRDASANLDAEQASHRLALALSHAHAWVDLLAHSRPALQLPAR